MSAVLRSRIPEIIAELPGTVEEAIQQGTSAMAEDAANRAPVVTGNLRDSLEADRRGIWAAWYWFLVEFGTSVAGAYPFLIPAVEAGMQTLIDDIKHALGDL